MKHAVTIGCPGSGKTRYLLDLLAGVREYVENWRQVGFVTFTRAARSEASHRAADRFGVPVSELEGEHGWFKTLHSICYRECGYGRKALLLDNKAGAEWVESALGGAARLVRGVDESSGEYEEATPEDKALALWSVARNRLEPLERVWREAYRADDRHTPHIAMVARTVRKYEAAKRDDAKADFTDLLLAYAGLAHDGETVTTTRPAGQVPEVKVWFFDEQQDTSQLQWRVIQRLTGNAAWVYAVGDPFQAIYTWAGADPQILLDWYRSADKTRILGHSWRCAGRILAAGEREIRDLPEWFDRRLTAETDGGRIQNLDGENPDGGEDEIEEFIKTAARDGSEWMFLARSNYQVAGLASMLDRLGYPYRRIRQRHHAGRVATSVEHDLAIACHELAAGGTISSKQWGRVIQGIPSMDGEMRLLRHGAKTEMKGNDKFPALRLDDLGVVGATVALQGAIADGTWTRFASKAEPFARQIRNWGVDAVLRPSIRIGTIHASKGLEADNVLVRYRRPAALSRSDEPALEHAEMRARYVAYTRARKRLVISE